MTFTTWRLLAHTQASHLDITGKQTSQRETISLFKKYIFLANAL